ncbi:2-oxoacid:acceptor oxidoreductase subunit alpha [candidate division KSB1 bacterium]|nr:2-oxoacid:acceptor oxidoreductase subunit alpha [candidate division KSB1 bacterium]
MHNNELTLIIGGDAGQGVESSGTGFCRALTRAGLHVFSVQENRSRIRGGHNYYIIKTSEKPIISWDETVHLLVALTAESVELHAAKLEKGGAVICDSELGIDEVKISDLGISLISVPINKIAEEHGSKIMSNTAALAALAGLTHLDIQYIYSVIETNFKKKGAKVVESNRKVAQKAYDYVVENYGHVFPGRLNATGERQRMIMNGNQALSLGALVAGCNFVSAYPMTPGSSIFEWLNSHGDQYGLIAKQTEDEIAAILMAIGAAHVGARALVPTSGGGFSLMVEGLGLAAMVEDPVVIVIAQRPGPATGLATRSEQADLLFAIHAHQAEFPRIVLAPGDVKQCYEIGARAMNLAEKYQVPVIIMTEAFLTKSNRTLESDEIDFKQVKIDRGDLLTNDDLDGLTEPYKRYAFSESGISPRALPGHPNAVYLSTSNEHTEFGNLTEDAEIRTRMHDKRMRKLQTALSDMAGPELIGPESADVTFVCWGGTVCAVREAVNRLNNEGKIRANGLQFIDLWPFPVEKTAPLLERSKNLIAVEGNYTSQLALLIRMMTGVLISKKILKYDGRPISPEFILSHLKEVI